MDDFEGRESATYHHYIQRSFTLLKLRGTACGLAWNSELPAREGCGCLPSSPSGAEVESTSLASFTNTSPILDNDTLFHCTYKSYPYCGLTHLHIA
jgi:hypothetical protein